LCCVLLTKYQSDYKIKKTGMGRACSTHGEGKVHSGFWWGDLREGDHMKDPGIDGRVILK
jgi:hypothetical protein